MTAPAAAVAVAVNYDGSQIWAQDKNAQKVTRINVADNEQEEEFNVSSGTEWIFATSYNGEIIE